ncbi:putative tartrate dehydrogenase/decarboxylase TtuC [Talaromyces atroroseus]|uniref:D-malate dehydrogenase (decarboxylating) n=1 Tax=Talaromyces atroroseus TaxID=1441469 RepID=A0A225AHV0_TALAT|nr:putative tartrate dehydrogenase/decarboxylase TtuC [Talaromyces atroroseus]OKL61011.1 putative tartrate dehydrogenase/decarboxylase TtuC [Talaromyces atroroseus]
MNSVRKTYRIASIPGDGIGVEVTEQAIRVLKRLEQLLGTFTLDFHNYDWSSERYQKTGEYIPAGGLESLKNHDAIFFGAVGSPDVADHISLWGLILPIRKMLGQYVNVRPIRVLPGLSSPLKNCNTEDLDWVMIRENSEGEYAGQGGITHEKTEYAIANDIAVFTRRGIERTMRFAFETAASRPRKHLTMVTKSNAQRYGMVLWDNVFNELAPQYPEVKTDKMLVDAMTVRMVLNPPSLDTIVATNLHGDILSDLAAALAGSIGVAPSSNLNPTRRFPSMFEPIHGSAPDIAGRGVANPVGTFWCAAEMLAWLGEAKASQSLMEAVECVCAGGIKTKDVQGTANTLEVTEAVIRMLEMDLASSN